MIKLLVKFAEESRELEIADPSVTIGRSSENIVALNDKKASRKHAQIERTEQGYRLNDLGSGNGTRVNGKDVNTALLAKGDEIKIGLTTIYVLDVDIAPAPAAAPAAVAPAAPPARPVEEKPARVEAPVAVAPAPAVERAAPAAVAAAPAPDERPAEPRRQITRRSTYVGERRSGGRLVATAATLLILGSAAYATYYYWPQLTGANKAKPTSATTEKKVDSTAKEAAAALKEIKAKVDAANPMNETIVRDANDLAAKYGPAEPLFEAVAATARQKWAEQVTKMKFEDVEKIVAVALREHRFGDATDALKPLKDGSDAARVATLLTQVDAEAKNDFLSVDRFGKSLVERKQYNLAIDHYRSNAPRFRGTVHYKTLAVNAESLEELAKEQARVEAEVASRPKPDTSIAKTTPKEPAPEPPKEPEPAKPEPAKPEPAKPVMDAPKMPAPDMSKPKEPAKPKEPPKPPPPPPPPPEKPKESEKPKEASSVKMTKKPDVLCNCKKVVKGVYCIKCDRVLEPDDLRRNVCKRCEEPPKKVEMCVKRYYMADGHPETASEKPVTYQGKVYDIPQEDRARIVYFCNSCEEWGDTQGDVKHKADCANKSNTIKVCTKSGTAPHVP